MSVARVVRAPNAPPQHRRSGARAERWGLRGALSSAARRLGVACCQLSTRPDALPPLVGASSRSSSQQRNIGRVPQPWGACECHVSSLPTIKS